MTKKITFEHPNCPHLFGPWCQDCVREIKKQARSEALEAAAKVAANMKIRLPLDENKPGEEPEFLKPMFSAAQFFQDQIAKEIRSLKGDG